MKNLSLEDIKNIFDCCIYLNESKKINSKMIEEIINLFKVYNCSICCLENYIKRNFTYILDNSIDKKEVIEQILKIGDMRFFIMDYLDKNLESFIWDVPNRFVFDNIFKYKLKYRELINSYLNFNKEDYVRYILTSKLDISNEYMANLVNDIVVMIVDEILDHEKLDYVDIISLDEGSFSKVVEIGSKIIKVGYERKTYTICNNPVILQPLIRVNLSDISDIKGTIEVVEKVYVKKCFSDEELYGVYKMARDKGIVLADLRSDNVGVLLSDNILHWNKLVSCDMSSRGFVGKISNNLKKGELVLLDSDFVYDVVDYYKLCYINDIKDLNKFEKRYIIDKDLDDFDILNSGVSNFSLIRKI